MYKKILALLIIICMSIIFFFSSQEAEESKGTSKGFALKIITFLDFNDALSSVEEVALAQKIDYFVRKTAHLSIYALLSFLIALFLNEYKNTYRFIVLKSTIYSFLYACTDEIHQLFVKGRSGEIRDVCIDTLGAILGSVFGVLIIHILKKLKKGKI